MHIISEFLWNKESQWKHGQNRSQNIYILDHFLVNKNATNKVHFFFIPVFVIKYYKKIVNIILPQKTNRSITKLNLNCEQVLNHKADEPKWRMAINFIYPFVSPVTYLYLSVSLCLGVLTLMLPTISTLIFFFGGFVLKKNSNLFQEKKRSVEFQWILLSTDTSGKPITWPTSGLKVQIQP